MNYNTIKLSDVTKALKKAGFTKVDGEAAIFGDMRGRAMCYYKYNGTLYISGDSVGFCIYAKKDPCCCGYKYATSAIDATGTASEVLTNWPQFFFPRLFGYLAGEISEAEIIAEICA